MTGTGERPHDGHKGSLWHGLSRFASRGAAVRLVPVPPELVPLAKLARPDYVDAYAVALPPDGPTDPSSWLDLILRSSAPRWLTALIRVRTVLARALKLRTADVTADRSPFVIRSHHGDTVVTGEDDRHLDFRALLHVRPADTGRELLFVTIVQRHNIVGRAYFALVRPFHHVVVPTLLTRALRARSNEAAPPLS